MSQGFLFTYFSFRLGDVIQLKQDQKREDEEKSKYRRDKIRETTWYHEGPQSLKEARFSIACK